MIKLARLHLKHGKIIIGSVQVPESHDYYNVRIIKIENRTEGDWKDNDEVKISKSVVEEIKYLSNGITINKQS